MRTKYRARARNARTPTLDGGRDAGLTRVSPSFFLGPGPTCCVSATLSGSVASITHPTAALACASRGLHMVPDLPPLWTARPRYGRRCVREWLLPSVRG